MTPLRASALIFLVFLPVGCTQFPALDDRITPAMEAAPYPELVPLEGLLAAVPERRADPVQAESSLSARVANLRARAARLRGPILSTGDRDRLNRQPG